MAGDTPVDPSFIGSVISSLPLDNMISAPLQAMIKAQTQAAKSYADFLLSVCIKDGKAVSVQFEYDETIVDESGASKGTQTKIMRIPLLAAVVHPIICIEEGSIDFELEISQSATSTENSEQEGSLEGKIGWGPFSVSVKGRVSHKSEQTRKTDTRAKYSIHTSVKRQPMPEALSRVVDFLTDASTKPAHAVGSDGKVAPPVPLPPTDKSGLYPPPVADKA
ncbi:DUF2589 domain-containing protein [Enterobacteriaceae bacterium H16N7]|uniref:DUF2589 domain-containing protein n=1 Tax=Cedecea sulfonylureivorans TaxID=3051154 RepID=UPI0019266583|nr:DUF2589 domain-containing protein [Cedecea sulfonylureivorans]MCT4705184.1 DUF2589 domain-containing protein [Dryocola clanedunensis]